MLKPNGFQKRLHYGLCWRPVGVPEAAIHNSKRGEHRLDARSQGERGDNENQHARARRQVFEPHEPLSVVGEMFYYCSYARGKNKKRSKR